MAFEYTTLGEYAKVQGGFAYKSKDFEASGNHRVLKIKNVRFGVVSYEECAFIADEIANATEAWKTKEGDILISMTGSGPNAPQSLVGRVARVWKNEPEAFINQRVGRIQLKQEGSIHLDYLFYLLSLPSSQNFLVANSSGSANQANISGKTIELLPCPRISFKDSKRIAEIGLALDEKILLNQQTNNTLEQMAQALFKSWFVDFDPVVDNALAAGNPIPDVLAHRVEIRRKAHASPDFQPLPEHILNLFPSEFEQTGNFEIGIKGWVPTGFQIQSLGDVCSKITDGSHSSPKSIENGLPMASVKDMHDWGFDLDNCRRISDEDFIKLVKGNCKPQVNDVLIAKDGSYLKHIFVNRGDSDVVLLSSIAILRTNELVTPNYLALSLKQEQVLKRMENYVSGAVLQRIVLKDFRKFQIVIAKTELQHIFENQVSTYYARGWNNINENESLSKLRDLLLPKLISGEIQLDSSPDSSFNQKAELQGV